MNPADFNVREGFPEDLDEILALGGGIPEAPRWPRSVYESILLNIPGAYPVRRKIFVASGGQGILGFAAGALTVSSTDEATAAAVLAAELESVAVSRSARRLGVGRALCEAVLDWCRALGAAEISLEVRSESSGPIALYRSLGFKITGRRPRYYAAPRDDALLMSLPLGRSDR